MLQQFLQRRRAVRMRNAQPDARPFLPSHTTGGRLKQLMYNYIGEEDASMVRFHRTIRALAFVLLVCAISAFAGTKSATAKIRHRHTLRSRHIRHHRWKHHYHRRYFSKQVRKHNRTMAIEFLRENSPSLTKIADLPPASAADPSDTSVNAWVMAQQEDDDQSDSTDDAIQGPEDAAELQRYDDVKVDVNEFKKEWLRFIQDTSQSPVKLDRRERIDQKELMATVVNWLGIGYYYGGTSREGIDCSAFTRMVYDSTCGVELPRTAHEQYLYGSPVDRDDLEFGDLIFFHTLRRPYISHVGIYLGDNLFAHASSSYGVTISSLESTYYDDHFIGARRVIPDQTTASNQTPMETGDGSQ